MKKKLKREDKESFFSGPPKIYRIMKLVCLFLIVSMIQVSAATYGQNSKLSLSGQNITIEQLLSRIEDQSDFSFFYNLKEVDLSKKINLNVENKNIEEILNSVLKGTDLTYTINDRLIIIHQKNSEKNLLISSKAKIITGKVTDNTGASLPGVTVIIKGTTEGTTTDIDGKYSLNIPKNAVTLVFSYIGMKTKEVAISSSKIINIEMEQDYVGLGEVVAVGYGVQKKSDLTGSVTSVKAEEMVKMPISRVDQALQGKVSGVVIKNNKAQPGSSPVIRIRGDNSISGDNDPLVVVDGILGADMSILDPSEIESVEVLKDASAKAIYGSRGANGVIIITTKSGEKGKTVFNFSTYGSVAQVINKLDLMNAKESYDFLSTYPSDKSFYNEIQELLGVYDSENPVGTDWQDVIFRDATTQNYNLSVSGGNAKTTFIISAGYYDQEGIICNTGYDRQTLRARIDHHATDKLDIGANLYLSKSKQDNTRVDTGGGSMGGSVTQSANRFSPFIPIFDSEGNYSSPVPASYQLNNPAALVNERTDKLSTFKATANLYAQYAILKSLKFRTTYTGTFSNLWTNYWAGKTLLESSGIGKASITSKNTNSWLNENTLTFDKTYGMHHLTLMGGASLSGNKIPVVEADSQNFPTEALKYYGLELGSPDGQSVSSGYIENNTSSFLARINYVFNEKYLFTANFRADGSSKFAKNNKWGYFPSAAIGWRVTEENWMKNIPQISNLKLRLSYGSTGSQAISSYQSLASYSNKTIPLGSSFYTAITSNRISNSDLKWETTKEGNFGFDFGMFENRISLSADIYKKTTNDLLYSKNLPYYTGYSSQTQNIGSVENKGIEFALNTVNCNKAFKWETSFNISFNKNKVTDLGEDDFTIIDSSGGALGEEWRDAVILKVGESLGSFYGYKFDGIYQNQAECNALEYPVGGCKPGMIKLKDISGPDGTPDGKITSDDRTIIGCGLPDFTYGFSNNFSFKNFDMNIMFQGSHGNDILNINRVKLEGGQNGAEPANVLEKLSTDSWTGEGTSNTIQKIGDPVGPPSTRFIEDGSYLRLKNLSIGYTFPSRLTNLWHISKLRLYLSGQNLLTITDYTGYDPEINSRTGNTERGVDYGGYPTAKTYTIGLNLSF